MTEFIIKDPSLIQKLDQLNEKELEKLSEVLEEEIPKLCVSQTPTGIYQIHIPLQVSHIVEKEK